MLDAITFEKRGIPAAVVITEPFVPTALAMARLAGMPGYPHVALPHPIGSLWPDELAARADAAVAKIEALLLAGGQSGSGEWRPGLATTL